ncbi:hypothetical protein FOZ63_027903, partial [Perkinsus olseni]
MVLGRLLVVWLSIFYTPVALTSARKREWRMPTEGSGLKKGSLTVSKLEDQKCRISQADFHWLYYIADNHVYTNALNCTDENHRDFHFEFMGTKTAGLILDTRSSVKVRALPGASSSK